MQGQYKGPLTLGKVFWQDYKLSRGVININIWEDHWIPTSPTRMVYNRRGQIVLKTVNELIDPISKTWDEELARSLFMQVDAERILHIPLITQLPDDFVAWQQTKNFIFSV